MYKKHFDRPPTDIFDAELLFNFFEHAGHLSVIMMFGRIGENVALKAPGGQKENIITDDAIKIAYLPPSWSLVCPDPLTACA